MTEADGPPSDSNATANHFTCGTDGSDAAAKHRRCRYRGSVDCIGSWHTHPTSGPYPNRVDVNSATQILTAPGSSLRTVLVLILSGSADGEPVLGGHAFRSNAAGKHAIQSSAAVRLRPQPEMRRNVGIALSGGGFRAIAFHLGCLRALHDLNLLCRLRVISSVSGGSIISAMYAYSSDSFGDFDRRVVKLLSRGLRDAIVRKLPGLVLHKVLKGFVNRCCAYNRTDVFRDVLAEYLFGDACVHQVARKSLQTVINATELRTGSAFRFGSRQSGCWRFGVIAPEDALVADAVAASAAYPLFFPALERSYRFTKGARTTGRRRVMLADGEILRTSR